MDSKDKRHSHDPATLSESLVKASFGKLNWPKLEGHLEEIFFSKTHLEHLRGHLRRHSSFICRYPNKAFEKRRRVYFQSLQSFVELRLGRDAKRQVEDDIELLETIECGYRGILALLDKCAISQLPPTVRVSAIISRACHEYHEWKRRHDIALSSAQDLDLTSGILITGDDGKEHSLDTVLEELSVAVAMTLVMEAHKNNWFENDILTLPRLPTVGDVERYQSGSMRFLATCWQQWQKIDKRSRYLGGELKRRSGGERPIGTPTKISTLYTYCPEKNGVSEREVYDFISNTRLKDQLIQSYFDLDIETRTSEHVTGIGSGALMPPENLVSVEEALCCTALSDILGYSVVEDEERSCGLRLIEWIRGYIVVKELVNKQFDREPVSPSNYLVSMSESKLIEILCACGLSEEASRQFVSLTCVHRRSRDMFDCPIIKVSGSEYLLFGPGLVALNVPVTILSNLSERRVSLGRKGKAFEQSLKRFLHEKALDVYSFRARRDDQEFEYDAVLAWDGYLFLFECKNRSLSGNDPTACYYLDLEVRSEQAQVLRLADALRKHPDIIEEYVGKDHVDDEVVPCVIHSLPFAKFENDSGVCFF